MDEVEYQCTKCRRPIRALRGNVLQMLAKKRTRCQVCGSPLEFPADVTAEFEGAHKVGGADVRDKVTYKCSGCGRAVTRPLGDVVAAIVKKKTNCPLCQAPFDFPPEVLDAVKKLQATGAIARHVDVECPTCLRSIKSDGRDPEAVVACGYCGARCRAPLEGTGNRAPPPVGEPATSDEVQRALAARMPQDEIGRIAAQALIARAARGEVARGEVEDLSERHRVLAAWRAEDRETAFVAISESEAETLVPAILFPGLASQRDRTPEGLDLVFTVGHKTAITGTGAVNLIGATTFLALGAGIFVKGGGDNTREAIQRLRVRLGAADGGVELSLAHQTDDGRPKSASKKEHAALRDRVVATAPAFRSYYTLLAIWGPGVRGTAAVVATAPAIEKRLVALGEPLAPRAGKLAAKLKLVLDPAPR